MVHVEKLNIRNYCKEKSCKPLRNREPDDNRAVPQNFTTLCEQFAYLILICETVIAHISRSIVLSSNTGNEF
jgi:hypothetical protein